MSNERYQFIRCYAPDGSAFVVLGEVYVNEHGEIWNVCPVPVNFAAATEGDLVAELEKALADCRAHPVFDSQSELGDPPADLIDDIRREQLEMLTPPTKSRH
jgi:hypothetical protein